MIFCYSLFSTQQNPTHGNLSMTLLSNCSTESAATALMQQQQQQQQQQQGLFEL